MLSTNEYCPAAHWFLGPGGSGMRRSRAEAYWRVMQQPAMASVEDISLIFFEQNTNGRYVDREDADLAEDTCDSATFEEMRDKASRMRRTFEREAEQLAEAQAEQVVAALAEMQEPQAPAQTDLADQPGSHHYLLEGSSADEAEDEDQQPLRPRRKRARRCLLLDDEAACDDDDEEE